MKKKLAKYVIVIVALVMIPVIYTASFLLLLASFQIEPAEAGRITVGSMVILGIILGAINGAYIFWREIRRQ